MKIILLLILIFTSFYSPKDDEEEETKERRYQPDLSIISEESVQQSLLQTKFESRRKLGESQPIKLRRQVNQETN